MKILKIGIIIIVTLVVLLGIASMVMSDEYDFERSIVIDAEPAAVHAYVGELKSWDEWTPWKQDDPSIEITYGDKTTGVGASQSWTGKDGKGKLTFTRCDVASGIAYDMVFTAEDGTEMPAACAMNYEKSGKGTKVTWTMSGKLEGMGAGIFAALMPSMAGKMFDRGLESLKKKVESK